MSQEINGHIIREKIQNITLGAAGVIGTAAATVDIVSHVGVIASAAGLTFTLPAPTDTRSGLDFRVTNAGTNTFTIGSKAISANDYADFSWDNGAWHSEASANIDLYRDRGMPNTLMTLSGVATYARPNSIRWTGRFIILGGGRGPGTLSTAGYYDLQMPGVGTVIEGVGVASVTVTTQGIPMQDPAGKWSVLYYILPAGGAGTVFANYRLAGYSADFIVPDNWVMVAAFNSDAFTIRLGNDQLLKQGTDSTGNVLPFDAVINFSQLTPAAPGVAFSPNTPANDTVLYVSSVDGSQWTFNGSVYVPAPLLPAWQTAGNAATNQATNFLGTTDNVGLSIRTSNQIRQTITAAGNVGVGVTAPLNKLHIGTAAVPNTGGIRLPITSTSGAQTGQPIGVDINGDIVRLTPTTFDATIDFNQATPTTPGVVFAPNTPASTTVLYVSTTNGSQWTYNGTTYVTVPVSNDWQVFGNASTVQATNFVGTTNNVGLSLRTNNQIRQTIDAAGNVGIGTVTPTSRMSISGGTNDIGFYNGIPSSLNQGKQAIIKAIDLGVGDGHMAFETYAGGFGGSERMRITRNGNVGINTTTPLNKLHVVNAGFNPAANDLASVKVEGGFGGGVCWSEGANRSIIWADSGRDLRFCTGGTVAGTPTRMMISLTGDVGIGTVSPTQKLEVAGNIRATAIPNFPTVAAAAALLPGVLFSVGAAKVLHVR